ncbi:MAG: hypothetical protein KDC05_11495 [Bacteroidales bacterium]|nr:hypothetical protein [Bacteroidales bacterium]
MKHFLLLVFFASMGALAILSCSKDKTYQVRYTVQRTIPSADTNNYLVTFYNQVSKVAQDTCYNGRWSFEFMADAAQFIYVSVFPPDTVTDLTVSIIVDGAVFKTLTGKGFINPKYNRIADGITIFGATPESD